MTGELYAEGHGQAMANSWTGSHRQTHRARHRRWSATVFLERTTGFEPATPTLARFLGRVL
jgi:hypothetical protein